MGAIAQIHMAVRVCVRTTAYNASGAANSPMGVMKVIVSEAPTFPSGATPDDIAALMPQHKIAVAIARRNENVRIFLWFNE